jgi:hypothetical protein
MSPGLIAASLCAAFVQEPDLAGLRERLKRPEEAFAAFQELVAGGRYGQAHELLSPAARKGIAVEAFTLAFGGSEAARRLVAALKVHAVTAEDAAGRVRVCAREFGVARELRLQKFLGRLWTLDLAREDVEYFRSRTLGWYRLQVRRADGWHFAYPPDWTYAPLGGDCGCKR